MRKPEQRERIPSRPPLISPLHDVTDQPVWSVMIAVDNTFSFLNTTLLSVLEMDQGIGVMQIMVVDDASVDGDVEQLVKDTGKGRIGYFRQPSKVGRLRNLETSIKLSRGKYVHILYGDNYVMPGFYDEILALFNEFPRVGAAFTEFQYINERGLPIWKHQPLSSERGLLKNWVRSIALRQNAEISAMVIKRSTYEKLGSYFGAEHGEFWEMTVRIAAHAELAYLPKVYANFRIHGKALHSEALKTGKNIEDVTKIIGIIRAYLPLEIREEVNAKSKKYFSQHFAQLSHKVYHELNDTGAALKQAWGALVLDINWISLKYAMLLFLKYLIGYKAIRNWIEKVS